MHDIDTINSLLRGELAATETYKQALDKVGHESWSGQLRRIFEDHREAANTLRKLIREEGGVPDQGSGAWGVFAKAVEGTATLFSNAVALKALKEGEESGMGTYTTVLEDQHLPAKVKDYLTAELIPQTRAHISVLDHLMSP